MAETTLRHYTMRIRVPMWAIPQADGADGAMVLWQGDARRAWIEFGEHALAEATAAVTASMLEQLGG